MIIMLLTTKGRYGLKAVFDIALNGSAPLSLKTIATRQGISDSYLEILISTLKKGGIVISTRGAQGGYELARDPDEITVGDILRVLEGPMAPAECVMESHEHQKGCTSNDLDCIQTCAVHSVLKKLYYNINTALDSMTLQSMLDEYKNSKRDDIYEKSLP